MKTLVIHHSADMDGIFCREIARKFLPDATIIGWDFPDKPIVLWEVTPEVLPYTGPFCGFRLNINGVKSDEIYTRIVVMDLPLDAPFGLKEPCKDDLLHIGCDWIWIDHHASAIATHPQEVPGYRIDGVAACRLAWQWFSRLAKTTTRPCPYCGAMAHPAKTPCEQGKECPHCGGIHYGSAFCPYTEDDKGSSVLPSKQDFIDRKVSEPIAVRLAGEYDIWDKRDPDAELFQHGLRSQELKDGDWKWLLSENPGARQVVEKLLNQGTAIQYAQRKQDEFVSKNRSFDVTFEGLEFLAINTVRCNSLTFEAAVKPHHAGLLGFYWNGKEWNVSMYHAPHRKDLDLSAIAVKFGGGGHRGACGFRTAKLPFIP